MGAVAVERPGQQMDNDFAVAGRLKNRALFLQFGPQPRCVGQIAVVADGDLAAGAVDDQRLGVLDVGAARGGVADVADGQMPGQRAENVFVEHLSDQPHTPVGTQVHAIRRGDAGAFLPAVLERVQSVVRQFRCIRMTVNAEQATIMPWPRAWFRIHQGVSPHVLPPHKFFSATARK